MNDKIYTKTGDNGWTRSLGEQAVRKSDALMEALGDWSRQAGKGQWGTQSFFKPRASALLSSAWRFHSSSSMSVNVRRSLVV